ncbi:mucoidy inhibitor MuiA family protein [Archangium sp.]|uniref:mucoidy inhibitor MuiA family protein n=1 Tax=Archangium sp. TaxID=1872627 RepID=UPI002D6A25E3|nr:mucoidy inhibitor MuiA family protein [Archangium sp.]HYO57189.1 mucoidy inhibitor MuiA family protein [Archangium sp.]
MPIVESRLDTVTLYHQGARVSRLLSLDCPEGKPPSEIEIPRLPLSLFDAAVRVRVLSTDNPQADLSATHVRVGLWIPPREAPLDTVDAAALRTLRTQVRTVESQLRQLDWEMSILGAIPVPERPEPEEGKPPPPAPLGARIALEQFSHEGVQSRLVEARTLREQLRKLNEEVAVLEEKMARSSTAREVTARDLYKSVHVQLRHGGGELRRAELSVEYFVPGARWAPSYQCRLSRDCRQVELVTRALICQHSGEDWRGVKLVLSTAAPMSWTELPELASIRIGRAQPPPPARAGFRPPPQGATVLFSDYDRDRTALLRGLPAPAPYSLPALAAPSDLEEGLVLDGVRDVIERREEKKRLQRSAGPGPESLADELSLEGVDGMVEYASAPDEEPMAPPPAPALMARPMMAAAPAPASRSKSVSRAAGPGGAAPSQAGLEAVVFTHLRLSPASDAQRNRLQPVDARRFYLESLSRFSVEVRFDVMAAVAEAEIRARSVADMVPPGGAADVRAASGHFDFSYAADATVDVPSDGAFHSVALGTRTGEASVLYVAVPREDNHVYRQAQVKNPLPAPMLPGPAEVYVGGEYVLSTLLPAVPPRGEFKLGLGVEQAIRCARNTRFSEVRSGEKIVAMTELWHDILIDLVNNLDREILCEVRERIPQPGPNAEVVVEEGAVSPAWEPYTQEERGSILEGGRRWRLTVPANGTSKLSAQYVVKLYANNELSGGNRREA